MNDVNFLTINTDGGSSNKPGPAGIGIVFQYQKSGEEILDKYYEYIGEATNNQAEYKAVLRALEINQKKYKAQKINFILDSQLVERQLKGEYKIKNPELQILALNIQQKTKDLIVGYNHVLRDKNKIADSLVKKAIKTKSKGNI